jgi:hypothetical protein
LGKLHSRTIKKIGLKTKGLQPNERITAKQQQLHVY